MAFQAQDTFTVRLNDGSDLVVRRGEVFADAHEVVKLDGGRGLLFKPLDVDGPPKPAAKPSRSLKGV